jgi:hypothetical protein
MPEVERDEHGHVRLAELELDRLLARQVKDRFRARGHNVTVEGKNIGCELRCAPPIPFDIEYTHDLGYAAVDYLKRVLAGDGPDGMITIQDGHLVPLPFGSFTDPETGRVRIRLVDVESSSYRVAREYMIRLDWEDLNDPGRLGPIAAASGLTPRALPRPVRLPHPGLRRKQLAYIRMSRPIPAGWRLYSTATTAAGHVGGCVRASSSARCLMVRSIFRSITHEPGSTTG